MWELSSRHTRIGTSLLRRLYTEHMLSNPPHATKPPEGEYAQVITHEDLCNRYILAQYANDIRLTLVVLRELCLW
jgi:hypothetical protein